MDCGTSLFSYGDEMQFAATILMLLMASIEASASDAPQFSELLTSNPKLNRWLTVQMPEVGGGPLKSYKASDFLTSELLWQNGTQALYYATAKPPTYATREEIVVLIAARRGGDGKWRVMKSLRLEAAGIEEFISVKPTYFSHIGPGKPVVTVTLNQGGHEYNYSESFTYTMSDDNFILHQPGGRNF